MRDYLNKKGAIRFAFPIDGDCLNEQDGKVTEAGLVVTVWVEAPENHIVEICGKPASFRDGKYYADVLIADRDTVLTAEDKTAGTACQIAVFQLKNPMGGYRLSSDDNILFLCNINDHKDTYKSIFENPYLAIYKKAHDLYGAKVHLNLFYEFQSDNPSFKPGSQKYFNLSMMTDTFREEFRATAHWLKLSFHAKAEHPDEPYKYATGETVREHAQLVNQEILRFAGPEVLSACTTIHWGEANENVVFALRDMGYLALAGYFMPKGAPVAYYAPRELVEYVYERDFWKDTQMDMFFARIDAVINRGTLEENLADLKEITASATRGGFVSIMIHEQYFYPDYVSYLPDFENRILECCKFLAEKGYEGHHLQEVNDFGYL